MVAISVLEFAVYGIVAYSAVLMLIISTVISLPSGRSFSIARTIYMLLGMIFSWVLAGIGPEIHMPTIQSNMTVVSNVTNEMFTETTISGATVTLLNGVTWMLAHMLMGVVMLFFIVQQILMLLVKAE